MEDRYLCKGLEINASCKKTVKCEICGDLNMSGKYLENVDTGERKTVCHSCAKNLTIFFDKSIDK